MTKYIQFTDTDGSTLLIEADEAEVYSEEGIVKAGLNEIVGKAVTTAQTTFEQVVDHVIQHNSKAFLQALRSLPAQDQPESMEVTFAFKATGELGNTAVARGIAEANYIIKLTWKR